MSAEFEGLDVVLSNLQKEIKRLDHVTQAGVVSAALWVKGKAQRLAPVVTGNLQNSAFVTWPKGGRSDASFTGDEADKMRTQHAGVITETKAFVTGRGQPSAAVGFSAVYTRRVHENPRSGKTGGVSPKGVEYKADTLESGAVSTRKIWATSGQWKFLETPLKRTSTILAIIANRAKIK